MHHEALEVVLIPVTLLRIIDSLLLIQKVTTLQVLIELLHVCITKVHIFLVIVKALKESERRFT